MCISICRSVCEGEAYCIIFYDNDCMKHTMCVVAAARNVNDIGNLSYCVYSNDVSLCNVCIKLSSSLRV